jgi:DNA primase
MSIDTERDVFKCFGCGAGGSVIDFVMRMEKVSVHEAGKILGDRFASIPAGRGREIHRPVKVYKKTEKNYMVSNKDKEIYNKLDELTSLTARGYVYLTKERGLSEATIMRYGIHSIDQGEGIFEGLKKQFSKEEIGDAGLLNDKGNFIFGRAGILIPFRVNGEIVYYEYRNYENGKSRKYICMKGRTKHYFVGDIDEGIAYVFEGMIDGISFYQLFGKANIIASNGINGAESRKINNYMSQYGYGENMKYIYMLDNDPVGIEKSKKLIEQGEDAYFMTDYCLENGLVVDGDFKDWNEVLLCSRES